MNEWFYEVYIEGESIAQHLRLEWAVEIAKAVMERYYNDPRMKVIIKREPREEMQSE